MRRIRCSDPEPDDPSIPVDWRCTSLIIATLFLNFSFCINYGLVLCCFGSLAVVAGVLGIAALLLTALFFIGPALAAQSSRCRIFVLVEHSFGSIPALVLRFCALVYLSRWIADLVALPALWALAYVPGRERSLPETAVLAVGILVFLFLTGLQSVATSARLALFTNKLCIVILIAAFIRVHDGWAAVPGGFPTGGQPPAVQQIVHSLSLLAFYVAPLLLVAADYAARIAGRKQVVLSGLTGLALPIFGALILSVVLGVATGASPLYRPSLNPTVAMALFSGVAGSAIPSRMFIAAITTFGAARFGVRALMDAASVRPFGKSKWVLIGCFVSVIAWLSLHPHPEAVTRISDMAATCLLIAGGVVTADFASGRAHLERVSRVDWVAVAAFAAGIATVLCLPSWYVWGLDSWWSPWTMPSYAVGFLVCFCGRALRRVAVTSLDDKVAE